MTIFKQLYRRAANFGSIQTEVTVGSGVTHTWTFKNPGWVGFDFMAIVPSNSGELPDKYFEVYVDGVKRFSVRGAWAWTREYIWVDAGTRTVEFKTLRYAAGDVAKLRGINVAAFPSVKEYSMIEATSLPKPLEEINSFGVLRGRQRYQRTGPKGSELEFTLIFNNVSKWRTFMSTLENFYVIKGDYGVYGGTILPQDVETTRVGTLVLMKCKLVSPLTAGVGVDGM